MQAKTAEGKLKRQNMSYNGKTIAKTAERELKRQKLELEALWAWTPFWAWRHFGPGDPSGLHLYHYPFGWIRKLFQRLFLLFDFLSTVAPHFKGLEESMPYRRVILLYKKIVNQIFRRQK